MHRGAESVPHHSPGCCPSQWGLQSAGTDSSVVISGAHSDPPGASMFCYGFEKFHQELLSHCYFCLFLKDSALPRISEWRLPTGAVEVPNCYS